MKSRVLFVRLLLIACVASLAACSRKAEDAPGADTVLQNGRIYTVDAAHTWAEAVAISNGRITYVGSDEGVNPYIGSATRVVDLNGRMMLPGMQDSHVHPISGGMEAAACSLNGLPGVAAYRSRISEYASAHPDVPWILGGGWAMSEFGPGGAPNKNIIDELVPNRPVFLTSQDGHSGWANSAALKIAGITDDTPDPADGRIDRDPETGEAIGSLQEGAMNLVTRHIPPTSDEDRIEGLRYAMKMLNDYGITTIQDAIVNEDDLKAYETLQEQNQLTLRVTAAIWWERDRDLDQIPAMVTLREKYTKGLIDAGTVKIMQDGVMENYTAVMLEPYLIPSHSKGIPMVDPELLKQAVTKLDAEGFQVHFHAIGDGAVRQCLDAIEEALIENGQLGHRHHIAHLEVIDPADIPRFKELSVVANFQPLWAYADKYITDLTLPFINKDRYRWIYPIKSVHDAGGRIAFGSDWSVSSANPYWEIETAVTRKDAESNEGEAFIPEERIDLETAIDAFTINAAFVNRKEKDTGSIEVGKYADLVVLDQNLFEIEPKDISDTKALLTLFAGKPVHGAFEDL